MPRKSHLKIMYFVLSVVLGTYLLLFLLLAIFQRNFIYYPSVESEPSLLKQAATHGVQPWRDGSGTRIGWRFSRSARPEHRIVIFHGNAGHALHRDYLVEGLLAQENGALWEVLVFEYPGYGGREGTPSEQSILSAGAAALQELTHEKRETSDTSRIYLLGESLGAGVAAHLAGELGDNISSVILITPFTNLGDVAAHHYPLFPARWAMRDRFAADEGLRRYQGPVAFLVAGQDDLVPTRLGLKLHQDYDGPKHLWVQDAAGHATLDYTQNNGWWQEVSDFLLETTTNSLQNH